jgi:hypothetical protein
MDWLYTVFSAGCDILRDVLPIAIIITGLRLLGRPIPYRCRLTVGFANVTLGKA